MNALRVGSLFVSALVLAAAPSTASAADHVVLPGDSIQAAIDSASPGDRVLVEPGLYSETIQFQGKPIQVIGVGGPAATTLDGAGTGSVVAFAGTEDATTRLQGFTITGGAASFGAGGIRVGAATPLIEDCIVTGNAGKFGGGVSGNAIMNRCSIMNNSASLTHGGGVYGAPQLSHCIIAGNTATSAYGGGLYLTGGPVSVVDCLVIENRTLLGNAGRGAGIYVDSSTDAVIENTVIASNVAGAGVFGAIGAGVFVESVGTTLTNCTIVGNVLASVNETAGGIYGPAIVRNSVVRGNEAQQLVNTGAVAYSDVAGGWPGAGNIDLDPQFVDESNANYHLRMASPCIDAGDPNVLDDDGTRSDIGAFPFQTLYVRSNTEIANWGEPNAPVISAGLAGDQVALELFAGADHGGRNYVILSGVDGSSPGVTLASGAHLPLNIDFFTGFALANLNGDIFVDFAGQLDGQGAAVARFDSLTSIDPSLVGLEITFAYALTGPLDFTSNALAVTVHD